MRRGDVDARARSRLGNGSGELEVALVVGVARERRRRRMRRLKAELVDTRTSAELVQLVGGRGEQRRLLLMLMMSATCVGERFVVVSRHVRVVLNVGQILVFNERVRGGRGHEALLLDC